MKIEARGSSGTSINILKIEGRLFPCDFICQTLAVSLYRSTEYPVEFVFPHLCQTHRTALSQTLLD